MPPFLATLVALVLLAGAVTSFAHDATWAATALVGTVGGMIRHRSIGAVIAVGVVAAALLDAVVPPGTLPRQAHIAAASSLFAGYLAGRAWSMGSRAARSPHVDLEHP